jgi:hypothetical protein
MRVLYPVINGYQVGQGSTFDNISLILPDLENMIEQEVGNTNILIYG